MKRKYLNRETRKHTIIYGLLLLIVLGGCGQREQKIPSIDNEQVTVYYYANEGEYEGIKAMDRLVDQDGKISTSKESSADKIIITLQDAGLTDSGIMSYMVSAFNRDNDTYQVIMERFQGDVKGQQERLKMELAAGKGPDIMTFSAIPDAPLLLDKNCFVDLSELMIRSDITDQLYFPAYKAFADGNKVYGLSPNMDVVGKAVSREVIGGDIIPDINVLIDKLYVHSNNTILDSSATDGGILRYYFLCGSDDLFGMIDWKNRECNFDQELFRKMLDLIKKSIDNSAKGYEPTMRYKYLYFGLYPGEEAYKKEGWVTVDYYFNDGNYPLYNWDFNTLFINSNTQNLEGAWAFLSYAMSKKGQSLCTNPVNIEVFDAMGEEALDQLKNGTGYMGINLTEQSLQDMKRIFATGKYPPIRTQVILNIIEEEADDFFHGTKTKEDIIDIIQKRVQLYLDEE